MLTSVKHTGWKCCAVSGGEEHGLNLACCGFNHLNVLSSIGPFSSTLLVNMRETYLWTPPTRPRSHTRFVLGGTGSVLLQSLRSWLLELCLLSLFYPPASVPLTQWPSIPGSHSSHPGAFKRYLQWFWLIDLVWGLGISCLKYAARVDSIHCAQFFLNTW